MRLRLVASTRGILGETASVDSTGLDRLGSEFRFTARAVFFHFTKISTMGRIVIDPEYLCSIGFFVGGGHATC